MNRELQVDLAIYNAGITRSRREYEAHPNSGVEWCTGCVHPVGSNKQCATCRQARRMREFRRPKNG